MGNGFFNHSQVKMFLRSYTEILLMAPASISEHSCLAISGLVGTWQGTGKGQYPTITEFDYEETLVFCCYEECPSIIHFEQRTKVTTPNRPSHWETGFIRHLKNSTFEMVNSQNSGRVEVLEGKLVKETNYITIIFHSTHYGNDPRMLSSQRVFTIENNRLMYSLAMATRTTETSLMTPHLSATLIRVD